MSRSEKQRIADLEAQVERLKERAAAKQNKNGPASRYVASAIKAIDAARASTGDRAMHLALQEARASLLGCTQLNVVLIPRTERAKELVDPMAILAFIQKNPGQRLEHIAAGLGTDSRTIRAPMKRLLDERKIKTKGVRRGTYWAG
jgi:hypothetical protein